MTVANAPTVKALLALLADPAVTRVRAQGRGVEVYRGSQASQEPLAPQSAALAELIEEWLGPGRASGSVAFGAFAGVGVLPPVSTEPVLVLHRVVPARVSPDAAVGAGLLTPELARAATTVLAAGAGVIVAGPQTARTTLVLSALVQLLPGPGRLALVEDELRIGPARDALRLRELPADLRSALSGELLVLDLARPPSVLGLAPPVLIAIRARSPEAACVRACADRMPIVFDRNEQAVLLADIVPLLLWYGPGARLEATYELLPVPDPAGAPCRLQMLLGTDPLTDALIHTGALPRDPLVAAAWADAGLAPCCHES